jgi:uncharacterized membrane protein
MLKKIKTRIRNPKVIIAVVSGILMILVNLGIIDAKLSERVLEFVNTLLGLGITVGIFADPESHIKNEQE